MKNLEKAVSVTKSAVLALIAFSAAGATSAAAPDPVGADQGIYGKLDVSGFRKKPLVINVKPLLAAASMPGKAAVVKSASKATAAYVHVPPGWERHWSAHCGAYDACDVPVYFVTEGWFVHVYLPAVGQQDGREQRYLIEAGRDKDRVREIHDSRADE